MSAQVTRAAQLAAQLRDAGLSATHDPDELAGKLPAVLVTPPALAFTRADGAADATWRLLAVADTPARLAAWVQLDELVQAVADLLPIESATPVSYAATADAEPLPAYALTLND